MRRSLSILYLYGLRNFVTASGAPRPDSCTMSVTTPLMYPLRSAKSSIRIFTGSFRRREWVEKIPGVPLRWPVNSNARAWVSERHGRRTTTHTTRATSASERGPARAAAAGAPRAGKEPSPRAHPPHAHPNPHHRPPSPSPSPPHAPPLSSHPNNQPAAASAALPRMTRPIFACGVALQHP
eukprot:COSAG02_NODE_347_length_24085_cov_23.240724_8_plen_181_part_00